MSERLELLESRPAEIEGVRFGVANIWERDFLDASGEQRSGLTAQLMFEDGHDEFVGEGSSVRLGESTWSVAEVRSGPPGAALVLLRVA